jgi:two-component system cell cycle sensor histidine kinase/response regulator CckA
VKQTGGFIFLDSVVGQGTTFTLYLPAQDRQDEAADTKVEAETSKPLPSHGEGVILLVEDEAPVRAFASRALRLRGYTVLEADSAEAALETLEDASLNIDVFVTDVVMPGMDGPSWVQKALVQRPDTRVVFVSGYAEDSFDETQARIPNSVFLPKPFSLTDLAETVHRQLH